MSELSAQVRSALDAAVSAIGGSARHLDRLSADNGAVNYQRSGRIR